MTPAEAFLTLALCMAADEAGTRMALKAGAQERGIQKPALRVGIKVSLLPLFIKRQKQSKAVRFGLPIAYCGAGAWNFRVANQMNGRSR